MKGRKKVLVGFVGLTFFLYSCAPSRVIRPLDKGEKQVSANLGGPLLGFSGMTIPMPLTSISYAQGVSDEITVFGGVHTTAMLYGVFQIDVGGCFSLFQSDSSRFGASVNPVMNMAYDKWEGNFKLWPELDFNTYWEIKENKSFIYLGASNWFELASKKAHEETQENRWLINPHIGLTYVREKWNYNFETKWMTPNLDTQPNVVDYKGVGGKGGIGIYLTFTRKF